MSEKKIQIWFIDDDGNEHELSGDVQDVLFDAIVEHSPMTEDDINLNLQEMTLTFDVEMLYTHVEFMPPRNDPYLS